MKKGSIKDLPASVRRRLQDNAHATGRPFQEVLQYYAIERFLYRLACSPHASRFVLKGALMFTVWRAPASRSTKDIDLLGRTDNAVEAIASAVREVCQQTVEPDGLVFHSESVATSVIKEDADYEGVRVTFRASLQNARVTMQIDVGFGDVMTPAPIETDYPTILQFPAPRLLGYSRETVVAEKFEAMIKLGMFNSRMKDFFDLWLLSRQFTFDGPLLVKAVTRTLAHRKTAMSARPIALTNEFATDKGKQLQWQGFLRKSRLGQTPTNLAEVIESLSLFLQPVASCIQGGVDFSMSWNAGGPWRKV